MANFKLFSDSKVLLIGAGSGRDIISLSLFSDLFKAYKVNVDIAGFLTPWSIHQFDNLIEQPVNILSLDVQQELNKHLPYKNKIQIDNKFIERYIPYINKNFNLFFNTAYLFSLQYGSYILKSELEKLVNENEYDYILVVDFGGDILINEEILPYAHTPIVDKTCLTLISDLAISIPKYLIIVSTGSDGELPGQIINNLDIGDFVIFKENLSDIPYKKYLLANEYTNQISKTNSFTYDNINRLINKLQFLSQKRSYIKVGDKIWDYIRQIKIDNKYSNEVICLNLTDYTKNSNLDIRYNSLDEINRFFYQNNVCETEISLSCIPFSIKEGNVSENIFYLNFNDFIPESTIIDVISEIKSLFLRGEIDNLAILSKNIDLNFNNISISCTKSGTFEYLKLIK